MRTFISIALTLLLTLFTGNAFAQEEEEVQARSADATQTDEHAAVRQVRKDYARLDKRIASLEKKVKALTEFKGKDADRKFKVLLVQLQRDVVKAQKDAGILVKHAQKLHSSKERKIGERVGAELETLSILINAVTTPQYLDRSVRYEFKQSVRALNRDIKKLGKTDRLRPRGS